MGPLQNISPEFKKYVGTWVPGSPSLSHPAWLNSKNNGQMCLSLLFKGDTSDTHPLSFPLFDTTKHL